MKETDRISADDSGGTPVAFDDRLWLIGANRSGTFSSAVLVSTDGRSWQPLSAPWSPRGGVAAWVRDGMLYMTGGKFSTVERGETVFTYSNDVWRMPRAATAAQVLSDFTGRWVQIPERFLEAIGLGGWWKSADPSTVTRQDTQLGNSFVLDLSEDGQQLTITTTVSDEKGEAEYRQVFGKRQ